jgi:hypothetical protein
MPTTVVIPPPEPAPAAPAPPPQLAEPEPPPPPAPPEPAPAAFEKAPAPLNFSTAVTDEPAAETHPFAAHTLAPAAAPPEPLSELPRPSVRAPAARGGSFGTLLLIFLIPYAVVTSGTIAYLLYLLNAERNRPAPFDPLERLPDPGQRIAHDEPLPYKLTTKLNQPLKVGDLEVKPLAIRRQEDRLLLRLKLTNVSAESAFNPLEPAFVKYAGPSAKKPYTFLQVGEDIAYGAELGLDEPPTRAPGKLFNGVLQPGESCVMTLETLERDKKVVDRAVTYRDRMLWRVQVRRGFVEVDGRPVSATAVIGVEFRKEDIQGAE